MPCPPILYVTPHPSVPTHASSFSTYAVCWSVVYRPPSLCALDLVDQAACYYPLVYVCHILYNVTHEFCRILLAVLGARRVPDGCPTGAGRGPDGFLTTVFSAVSAPFYAVFFWEEGEYLGGNQLKKNQRQTVFESPRNTAGGFPVTGPTGARRVPDGCPTGARRVPDRVHDGQ